MTTRSDFESSKQLKFFIRVISENILSKFHLKNFPYQNLRFFNFGNFKPKIDNLNFTDFSIGAYSKKSPALIRRDIDLDMINESLEGIEDCVNLYQAKTVNSMKEYQSFLEKMEQLGGIYHSRLTKLRKDSLALNSAYKKAMEEVQPKYLMKLRALNRMPKIDKVKEVAKILKYFFLKFSKYSIGYRLEEYNTENQVFEVKDGDNEIVDLNFEIRQRVKEIDLVEDAYAEGDAPQVEDHCSRLDRLITQKKDRIEKLRRIREKLSSYTVLTKGD